VRAELGSDAARRHAAGATQNTVAGASLAGHPRALRHSRATALALAATLAGPSACYIDGAGGGATPLTGPHDRGAQHRFAGQLGYGIGVLLPGGGFSTGLDLEY